MLLAFLLARLRVSAALRTFPLSCFDPRSPDIRVSHRTHNFDWPHAELIQVNREPVVTRSRGAGGTPMRRYSPAEGVPALLASSSNSRRSRFIVSSAWLTWPNAFSRILVWRSEMPAAVASVPNRRSAATR